MLTLKKNTVDEWLEDGEAFAYAFMRYSYAWQQAMGLTAQFDHTQILDAHSEWVAIYEDWKKHRFERGAEHLSYTKTFAILLHCLSQRQFCGSIHEFSPRNKIPPTFNGSDELKEEIRLDFLGAPEVVSALEFCICVMNFYESRRLDRNTPFVFRMTESSRHDLIAAILSDEMSPEAIFIAFENLYARH